jgi:DNA polymerase-3 subunit alpha
VEVVLFPEVWKQYASLVQKGKPVLVKARLQQGDDEVKLLAEQLFALNDPDLLQNATRRLPMAKQSNAAAKANNAIGLASDKAMGARPTGSSAGASPTGSSAGASPTGSSASARPTAASKFVKPAGSTPAFPPTGHANEQPTDRSQRVYIKISPDHEQPDILTSLKHLLLQHEGALSVLLYYEKNQKMLSLNDQFKVKPSEKLIQAIEELLGKDTAKVK